MTDNRTTELTATERICEQLEATGVSFERSEQIIEGTYWGVTWFVGETKLEFRENDKRTDLIAFNATPEQAIAATLGSEPDETELTQIYDAGFRNGVMAVFQQLEGVEDYEELQDLIAEYWAEGEGYDER